MVKNPPWNTADAGSISGQGTKIPHASGQPTKPTHHNERSCTMYLNPTQPKNKYTFFKKHHPKEHKKKLINWYFINMKTSFSKGTIKKVKDKPQN